MAESSKQKLKRATLNCCANVSDQLNCTKCVDGVVPDHIRDFRKSLLTDLMVTNCSLHDGKEFELFCETCGELICSRCIFRGQKHSNHKYDLIKTSYERFKDAIGASLKPMEQQLANVNRAIAHVSTCSSEIIDQQFAVESHIESTTRRLHDALESRKSELTSQLHQLAQDKILSLGTQKDHLEIIQTRLSHSLDIMRESLRTGSQGEVLMMKKTIVKHVEELTTAIDPETLEPCTQADMVFSTPPKITSICQAYGEILLEKSLDPSKFFIESGNLGTATMGEKCIITLKTDQYSGDLHEKHLQLLKYELVSALTGHKTTGDVEMLKQKRYSVTFKPTTKGKHQLNVTFEGQHIKGSPFAVTALLPVEKLGSSVGKVDGVQDPFDVAISQEGDVVVIERDRHHVSVFNPDSNSRRVIGSHGTSVGQFSEPYGIAVDNEGNIIVGDHNNHRIQKFTPEGQFIMTVGSKGTGPLQFFFHKGIACNFKNNKVYVVDESHVQILNSDFTFSGTFGKEGSGKGQFNSPWGIACDSTGKVYVADSRNHRIQVFTPDGKYLRLFGKYGDGRGELKHPVGVAVDSNDIIYVSDSDNSTSRVSVFTPEGRFVTSFGKKGKELGEFSDPRGLAIDSSGIVYVCDYGNSRILLF